MMARLLLLAFAVLVVTDEAWSQIGGLGGFQPPGMPFGGMNQGFNSGQNYQGMYRGRYGTGGYGYRGYGNSYGYGSGYSRSYGGSGSMNPLVALGQYEIADSTAAINYQQAYTLSIQNRKLNAQTFYDLRQMNASYRAQQAMLHPHATPEELAAFSAARLPAPLPANEFDPARGVIQWPGVLTRPEFDQGRAQLEGLLSQAAADPHASGPGTQNYRDIEQAIDAMSEKLHSEIAQFKPNEYIAASKFLKSLAFHGAMPGPDALAKQ